MTLLKKIKNLIDRNIFWLKKVLFAHSDYKVSIFTRIIYAFRGFTVNEFIWYNLKENDYRDYISDFKRIESRNINGNYKFILDDKLVFEEIFRNYIRVPYNYAYISHGNIFSIHDYQLSNDNCISFLKEKGAFVIKILKGYEGNGIYVIKYQNSSIFINGSKKTENDLYELIKKCDESIICEYIVQSKFENDIYDKSTNTLRIVCAKAKGEKYAKVLKAVQRIGTDYCAPVDNVSAGGLAAEIDINTGILGYAIAKYGSMNNRMKKMYNHPDNNNKIAGKSIPDWENIKSQIEKLTNKFPYLNFVAWDVLLTDEGICIIEGNASSGCGLFQLEHGIRNEEYGNLLESYGVFK